MLRRLSLLMTVGLFLLPVAAGARKGDAADIRPVSAGGQRSGARSGRRPARPPVSRGLACFSRGGAPALPGDGGSRAGE